ncbi:hypothetical protein SAGO17_0058 [Mimivirus AB-566-O17]|uniref:Nudix hydrolase domain-containing protein n=1 Tax=Mimivirus AB-566-O17 TaxID=1988039 RepID=A0A1X9VNT4_9VIRU|nr:hypothetical protein SAGO17_0058 [Mimivirus AB-566-O17]
MGDDSPIYKCAGVVLYRDTLGGPEFLLVENNKQKRFQYSFPKGKRERCETSIETAIRETREETGLGSFCYTLDEEVYYIEYIGDHKPHIIYYLAKLKGNPEIKPENSQEIISYKWVNAEYIECQGDMELTYQRRCILSKVLHNL